MIDHPSDVAVQELWRTYKTTGDVEMRNGLVLRYAPLVKYVAGRLRSGLPSNVDQNDLVSEGVIGLIDAIEKFDPERGVQFQTYAVRRIQGTIIDWLRSADWVPRSVREMIRDIERTQVTLVNQLHRTPTDDEVASALGISVPELGSWYAKCSYTNLGSLEELSVADFLHRPGDRPDQDDVELMTAVGTLPDRDRAIVAMYYFEGLALSEIGQVLGVTESRVSQLHTRATLELRAILSGTPSRGGGKGIRQPRRVSPQGPSTAESHPGA